MSSEEIRYIHGQWRYCCLLNMGSEATTSLESPSVSKRKARAICALLFVFLGLSLLVLSENKYWTKCRCFLPSLVSDIIHFQRRMDTFVHEPPEKKGSYSLS